MFGEAFSLAITNLRMAIKKSEKQRKCLAARFSQVKHSLKLKAIKLSEKEILKRCFGFRDAAR